MKKLTLAALSATVLLTACGSDGPGDTYIEMFKKMCDIKSIAVMSEYATPESQSTVQRLTKMMNDPLMGQQMKNKLGEQCHKPIKLDKVEVNGDRATVYMAGDSTPNPMKKIDGKWKVILQH